MKKLFTLVALLAMVLGANAKWSDEPIYKIDYTTYQGFPFYVMGYVPEFDSGYMTDFGANYKYAEVKEDAEETSDVIVKTQAGAQYYRWTEGGGWHQYFIADGIKTEIDGKYKVVAHVKASAACTINVNMGWSWSEDPKSMSVNIPGDSEFQEVTWEYEGVNGTSCNLVAQPGTCTDVIEWKDLVVYAWVKEGQREQVWLQDIENGNAETPWTDAQKAIKFNDQENNFTICAWSKERMVNANDDGGWDPFPAPIEVDPKDENNHVFVCHGQAAITEGDAAAWDNQFWIQSKHPWPSGTKLKIKFRYMCDYASDVTTNTQIHKQNPSDYLIWHAIGDITFTNEWKTFDDTMTMGDDMANGWSIAFNLNSSVKDAVNFYFDDLSWEYLQLDEGYFLAGINATTTTSYDDLDNAVQFEEETVGKDTYLTATCGTKGDAATYVDQVMVSTKRGDDQAFKSATLKPERKVKNDADDWQTYTASTNSKIDLPGLGVWKVYIDEAYSSWAFEMLEGTAYEEQEPVAIYTYAEEIVVKGAEREYTEKEAEDAGIEKPENPGQPWDNQFFIKADRVLKPGEVTHLKFSYKASKAAKTTTQTHGAPGAYIHWAAIGDVNFEEDWLEFDNDYTVPAEADGSEGKQAQSIAFNMAEIKDACDYYIKDIQWYLVDSSLDPGLTYENLISGSTNFYKKEGAGTAPYTGIETVTAKTVKTSAAIYNIAGQRVNKNYKGLVVKDGKKVVLK